MRVLLMDTDWKRLDCFLTSQISMRISLVSNNWNPWNSVGTHRVYEGVKSVYLCVDYISSTGSAYQFTNRFVHQCDQVGLNVSVAPDYAVLARQSFSSQAGDSIPPEGPTVDLVTAAIFTYSSSSSTSSFSYSLNLSHALSTSNMEEVGNSLTAHIKCTFI